MYRKEQSSRRKEETKDTHDELLPARACRNNKEERPDGEEHDGHGGKSRHIFSIVPRVGRWKKILRALRRNFAPDFVLYDTIVMYFEGV